MTQIIAIGVKLRLFGGMLEWLLEQFAKLWSLVRLGGSIPSSSTSR